MKSELPPAATIGLIAAVLVIVAVIGFGFFRGWTRPGQKPPLNPVLNRMYGPHPSATDPSAPQNGSAEPTAPQGRASMMPSLGRR